MKRMPLSLLPLLAACGGIDIEKVREDFNSPSGSVSNKEAVIAANGKRTGGGPALSLAGGGVPGASQGLTAAGFRNSLSQLDPVRGWGQRAKATLQALRTGDRQHALSAEQSALDGDCANSAEAQAAYKSMVEDLFLDALNPLSGGTLSGSADFEMDLSTCSGGELTGKVQVEIEVELAENRFAFRVGEAFDNVCQVADARACVNGELLMEASAMSDGQQAGQFEFITGLEIEGTWDEGGARREAAYKGGVRLAASGNGQMGQASVEYLFYVRLPDGTEYSYIWSLMASTDNGGTVKWSVRGSDGSIECSVMADGSGMCTTSGAGGVATLTWTAADLAALPEEYYEE